MKYKIILAILFIPFFSFAQERSIGVRLGEPLSVTYKDFISDNISYEFMLGSAGLNGSSYFVRDFENNPPGNNSFYVSHAAQNGISLNARMAYNEDFTETFGIEQGYLLGYGGVGVQLRTATVTYSYVSGLSPSLNTPIQQEKRTNLDFGPEAFVGAEYYFDDLPINIFAEVGIFMELLDRVGHIKGQGAIGIRYIF